MKLMSLLLVALIFHTSSYGQKITLSADNAPLRKIFDQIGNQTGFDFLFSTSTLDKAHPVTIHVKDASLDDVLKKIFDQQPLTYTIRDKSVVVSKKEPPAPSKPVNAAGKIDVNGRILDNKEKPLQGAVILVIATSQITSAGVDGKFMLKNVEEGANLLVTFVGFEQKTVKATIGMGDIQLIQSFSKLDEIQVVAYGTTTERLNTGSLSVVKSEEIEKNPVSNVMGALEGHVPGFQISQNNGVPGSNYKILLRGQNSLTQNADPLYVVDGVPFASTTLTKLRDVSAALDQSPLNNININDIESMTILKDAASTAIYGARGANGVVLITTKKGKPGAATRVDINAYDGIGKDTRRLDVLNTADYLAIRKEAFANTNTTPTAALAPDLLVWDQSKNTDWQKVLLGGTAHFNDIQGSVSGGKGNSSYLVGGGYHRETAVFPGNQGDAKASLHFGTSQASENGKFRILFSGSYMEDQLTLPYTDLTTSQTLAPNMPALTDKNGKLVFSPGQPNPLAYQLRPYNAVTDNLIGNSSISYNLLPGLQIKTNLAYNNISSNETQLSPKSSFDPTITTAAASSKFGSSAIKTWNVEPQISYNKNIGRSALNILVGSTFQSTYSHSIRYEATGFSSDAFLADMQAAKTLTIPSGTLIDAKTKFSSLFARITYNWDQKYLIDATGRRDGSSRFGSGYQFGNFGAVGLGWIFTKENLVRSLLPVMNFGKLRLSYGTVGNSPGTDYNYLSQWSVTPNAYDGVVGLYPTGLYNPNFRWELTKKIEAGLDLEFFNGRIQLSGDYYRNRSSDQLVSYPLPSITGFTTILGNLQALVQNTGWEFTLQTVNVHTRYFQWTTGFNVSLPRNKLVSFPGLDISAYRYNFVIGKPIYISKLYHYTDVNAQTGLYEFQGVNGPTSSPNSVTDENAIFDPKPKYYGGLSNNLSYKNFSLSFFLQFNKQIAPIPGGGQVGGSATNMPAYFVTRWQKKGDVTNVQRAEANGFATLFTGVYYSMSDGPLRDASFVRLKNVSFSYTLPQQLASKARLNNCRVYVQAQNLLTFTPFKGLDPETGNTSLPPLLVVTAGIQLTF